MLYQISYEAIHSGSWISDYVYFKQFMIISGMLIHIFILVKVIPSIHLPTVPSLKDSVEGNLWNYEYQLPAVSFVPKEKYLDVLQFNP